MNRAIKFKAWLIGLFILALPISSLADGWFSGGSFAALENANTRVYLEMTVSSTPAGFSASEIKADGLPARYVRISVKDADIRYRDDGGDPTATVGHLRVAGEEFVLTGGQINQFKAIRTDAVDAVLQYTLYF